MLMLDEIDVAVFDSSEKAALISWMKMMLVLDVMEVVDEVFVEEDFGWKLLNVLEEYFGWNLLEDLEEYFGWNLLDDLEEDFGWKLLDDSGYHFVRSDGETCSVPKLLSLLDL